MKETRKSTTKTFDTKTILQARKSVDLCFFVEMKRYYTFIICKRTKYELSKKKNTIIV